jgi:hypothetical protein
MKRKYIKILIIVIVISVLLLFLFDTPAENFKEANLKLYYGEKVLVLKGKRSLMSHDIISAVSRKTYVDSVYFRIPFNGNGVLNGEKIEVENGNYAYEGNIKISNGNVYVDLYFNNVDDKKLEPSEWNGKYNLKKNGL